MTRKIAINYDLLGKLAQIQCTQEEIASVLGISVDTIQRDKHAMDIYRDKIRQGKASLRRLQFQAAKNGDRTMLVWLGKQYLGQTDRMETDVTTKGERINQQTIRLTPGILSRSIAVLRDAGAIRPVSQPAVSDH